MFMTRSLIVFKRKNRFKRYDFEDEKKAQRVYLKMKRKGMDVQLAY